MCLLLNASDHDYGFAEVRLRLPRRMRQGHKHLPGAQLFAAHIVLHDGIAAGELMLFLQPVEDTLGRVPLLDWPLLVSLRMASITPSHGPSLGRLIGCCRC